MDINARMAHYEGLVHKTAMMLKDGTHPLLREDGRTPPEEDVEDIEQVLRVKIWRALRAYDPRRSKQRSPRSQLAEEKYVFMAVFDQCKDIVKRKHRNVLLIEDIATAPTDDGGTRVSDGFEDQYLSVDHEEVFREVEDEMPTLPSTLTSREREVVVLMYEGYKQTEIAGVLGVPRREVEVAVRGIRTKMADWKPSPATQPSAPPQRAPRAPVVASSSARPARAPRSSRRKAARKP